LILNNTDRIAKIVELVAQFGRRLDDTQLDAYTKAVSIMVDDRAFGLMLQWVENDSDRLPSPIQLRRQYQKCQNKSHERMEDIIPYEQRCIYCEDTGLVPIDGNYRFTAGVARCKCSIGLSKSPKYMLSYFDIFPQTEFKHESGSYIDSFMDHRRVRNTD